MLAFSAASSLGVSTDCTAHGKYGKSHQQPGLLCQLAAHISEHALLGLLLLLTLGVFKADFLPDAGVA